MERNRCREPGA